MRVADNFVQRLYVVDGADGLGGGGAARPVERFSAALVARKVLLARAIGTSNHGVRDGTQDADHHGEMLEVFMGLEEGSSRVQFDENAANAPEVARVGPAQAEDDLRGAVVSGGNDGRVVLGLKGGASKIDELDGVGAVVVGKQNVFRLEIGVDEGEVVHKVDALQ